MGTASSSEVMSTNSASPLLRLPKHIKEKIYRYALVVDQPLDLCKKSLRLQYALLNTCSQVRKEATAIFYSENIFIVSNIMSESLNLIKNADGTVTKLRIALTISKQVRKRCNHDSRAILKYLTPRAEQLPAFLLTWGPPAEGIEILEPAENKAASDRVIISALNTIFRKELLALSNPFGNALRKMARKKINEFVARETSVSGREDKVGMERAGFTLKAAKELNGGKGVGLGGQGVSTRNLMANLSLTERREVFQDTLTAVKTELDPVKNRETATQPSQKKKKSKKRNKAKKAGIGSLGVEGEPDAKVT